MSGFVPFEALMASAGSGKTFSLVVRYLTLLFLGEKADEILALTFTNKAAGEMQERIIDTLVALENRAELEAICDLAGLTRDAVLDRRDAVLAQVLAADTKVMTLDSFFAKILRKFALHAGIMPDFGTYEAQHALKVTARFLRLCAIEGKEATLVNMALLSTRRLADIFGLLDMLYAKAPELKGLVFENTGTAAREEQVMRRYRELRALFEGLPLSARAAKVLEAADIDALIAKTWVVKPSLNYWDFKKVFTPQMDAVLQRLQEAVRSYMRAKEQTFFAHLFELLELYRAAKLTVAKEDNELGFDDITVLVHYLLKERIDSDFLYFRLDSRISHLLLDEFQDTSVLQFEILRPLVDEMVSGSGVREHRSFFLVGDVKQSIYRFRGGTKALFGAVIDAYGLKVDSLRTNYRSSRAVVTFVNEVFRRRMDGYEDQQVKPSAREGYVEVTESEAPLETMVQTVKRLRELGARVSDIAVLTATNKDGEAVREALSCEGIDVVTETTAKLISQKRVRAVIEYLKYCYFGEDIYARNFCALADIEMRELPRMQIGRGGVADAASALIARYGLFDGDLNVVRFVEALERYGDMESFLFEYERLETKAVSAETHGVRVLTVHKSKGLEYPYVIVLDRLGKTRADTSPILYDYDGVRLKNLYLRQYHRKELDAAYAGVLEREAALAHDDALNALYVAFTRARENLYVIQKPKDSKFTILELSAMRQGTERVETPPQPPVAPQEAIEYAPLVLGRQKEIVTVESPAEAEDTYAVTYGLALHYALEMIERFDPDALAAAMTAAANRYGAVLGETALASIRTRIARLLEHPKFLALCDATVMKEQPLSYGGELRYLDVLVRHEDRWVVIDYKSARIRRAEHRKQVAFYLKAVRAITQMPVEGYLCYVLDEGVELVEVT